MRPLNLLVISCLYGMLIGCSSMHTTHSASPNTTPGKSVALAKPKNPMDISFYPGGKNPSNAYTVLGEAKISKFNKVGIKRQDAVIHDALRMAAASMGGDAIIEVKHTNKAVIGQVITFERRAGHPLVA